jgi:hypothetical protein
LYGQNITMHEMEVIKFPQLANKVLAAPIDDNAGIFG